MKEYNNRHDKPLVNPPITLGEYEQTRLVPTKEYRCDCRQEYSANGYPIIPLGSLGPHHDGDCSLYVPF